MTFVIIKEREYRALVKEREYRALELHDSHQNKSSRALYSLSLDTLWVSETYTYRNTVEK